MQIRSKLLNSVWNLATGCGMRRLGTLLKRSYSSVYGDTLFCWDDGPNVHGYVALTIDDGLRRSNPNCSMVEEVRDLLRSYNAHATFLCAPTTRCKTDTNWAII
jgi:peptidoglycan/xylan/chitin deacetylase (PgdA/CDA1 family)